MSVTPGDVVRKGHDPLKSPQFVVSGAAPDDLGCKICPKGVPKGCENAVNIYGFTFRGGGSIRLLILLLKGAISC